MKESVCNFGPGEILSGILTTPDADVAKTDAPTALILNAGIVHRIGPFRLHVDIARQMARLGYSTLRMDLSGLGESGPRSGRLQSSDRAELDVADAINFLKRETNNDQVVLMGLCSGAFNAHKVAAKDSRVVGAVFLDGIVFRTMGYYLRHRLGRFLKPRFWRNAVKRRLSDLNQSNSASPAISESEFFADPIPQDQVIRDLNSMMERGVQMLFLYTDGYDDICGRIQFKEMFGLQPDQGQLQVEYYPKSEHTFRLTENRRTACNRITQWFQSRFTVPSIVVAE
ncbi:MAG: alpha/beta fold hydrolase [Planctomycetota bacterium]